MELEVQKHLRKLTASGMNPLEALAKLKAELAIKATHAGDGKRVILNYDQIDSPKKHPVVRECRGLTLKMASWDVVARSFTRFFNAGEDPEQEKKFDWKNFVAESKEDGSLMVLYRHNNSWRVNTRGSFALGEITPGSGKTWEEVVWSCLDEPSVEELNPAYSYVFELCSPYNKVVRTYAEPCLFLLTAFHNQTGSEPSEVVLDAMAEKLRVKRPERYLFTGLDHVKAYLEHNVSDPTFEGVVLRDRHGMRIKVKSSRYVALHHLHSNGNIFHPKNLLPLVLNGEQGEVGAYFPEVLPNFFSLIEQTEGAKARMLAVWEAAKGKKTQKEFAQFVTQHTDLSSILFTARKTGKDPREVWKESQDLLVKRFAESVWHHTMEIVG